MMINPAGGDASLNRCRAGVPPDQPISGSRMLTSVAANLTSAKHGPSLIQ